MRFNKLFALSALLAVSLSASADVTYDANGVGFVGKGDIQDLFGWNSTALNSNAGSLQFQLVTTSGATWQCLGYNKKGNSVLTTKGLESSSVQSTVAVDVRKNKNGQVTGFELKGADVTATTYTEAGDCKPNASEQWQQQPVLVEGSLVYSGGGAPLLQVSSDGETWHDLPVTPVTL